MVGQGLMISQFIEFLKVPSVMLENGLAVVQTSLETAQGAIETLTGHDHGRLKVAPVDGPRDVDTAVSDFANRASQIVRYTPFDVREIPGASRDLLKAARLSFGYLDLKDPRNLVLPAQLMLSAGSLAAQSALRGLLLYEMLGPSRIQSLMLDFFYMFTDLPVYVGLEYQDLIKKCEERLKAAPDDHRIRYELGETLIKCGLYEEAETELRKIAPDSSYYQMALYEASVALYRAGQLDRAARTSVEALDANPSDERAKSWLWMTAQKMGGYPDFVPQNYRIQVRGGYEATPLEYEDIAERIGLDKTSGGRGTAIFDYDNDGYLDILMAASHGGCNLYHNNGDGTFTDVSIGSGWDGCVNAFALNVGDYDNDGNPDVFVSRLGFYAGDCQLYHNNGDGTFTDVTKQAGLEVWGPCFTTSWIDYDNDGRLDLFIPNNLGGLFERKTPNRLFHNNGDGTFTDVTEASGLSTIWPTTSGAWGDYDNNGWPDLFLSNGLGRSQLFRNNGDGTFTEVTKEAGIDALVFGSPAFWWDYDNDGWLDIGQFSWSNHEDVIYTWEHGEGPPDGHPMCVYHNNRDGTFTEVGRELGLSGCFGTMSGNVADLNNDGYVDIVFGNGSGFRLWADGGAHMPCPVSFLRATEDLKFRHIAIPGKHGLDFAGLAAQTEWCVKENSLHGHGVAKYLISRLPRHFKPGRGGHHDRRAKAMVAQITGRVFGDAVLPQSDATARSRRKRHVGTCSQQRMMNGECQDLAGGLARVGSRSVVSLCVIDLGVI